MVELGKFSSTETTPILYKAGKDNGEWDALLAEHPEVWDDKALQTAGKEFAKLVQNQRVAFKGIGGSKDSSEKATNGAVLSAWAFTAGMLQKNQTRLKRHYSLSSKTNTDPLNAKVLAEGRHKSDGPNYRGLGYRTDPRERAQMVELFYILAEDGDKITKSNVYAAITAYFAKKTAIEAKKARAKR